MADASIAAVGARIQERAAQLAAENRTLSETTAQLAESEATLVEEESTNSGVRRALLATVRSRHGVELEVMRLREEAEDVKRKASEARDETKELIAKTVELKSKWDDEAKFLYAKHDVDAELFKRRLEGEQVKKDEKRKRREAALTNLASKAEAANQEAAVMHLETKKLRQEIEKMDEREERDDEETAALALQIKATLAKKQSLRSALREAQQQHQSANDAMIRWEKECMELSRR